MDRDRRHLVAGMTIDKSEKRGQQFALVLGRRGANLGGDGLGGAAFELDRTGVIPVLPSGRILRLAPDPDIGSTSAFADRGLFGDESSIKACPCARNDLDDFHERPPASLACGQNIQRPPPATLPGNGAGRAGEARLTSPQCRPIPTVSLLDGRALARRSCAVLLD